MKKRILSMLLLVALLVTAIPVMAISATDTDYTNEDYAKLYAKQDNLVHLYMAFNNGDAADYYDLSTGKWFDMVGEVDATITDYNDYKWTAGANGGLSISIPDVTKDATNKIDFDVAALKDGSGNWYTHYTVDSALKIVNRQIPLTLKTYDAAALAAVKTTEGTDTLYNLPVEKITTSARTYITFTREDTTASQTLEFYWGNKTENLTRYATTLAAGQASATVNLPLTGEAALIKITGSDFTITELKRPISDANVKGQTNKISFAFGHLYVLRWLNLTGWNPETDENNGKGMTRFASGSTDGAVWLQNDYLHHTAEWNEGKSRWEPNDSDIYVRYDSKAVSTTIVKGVNQEGTKDTWEAIVAGETFFTRNEANNLSADSGAQFVMMKSEQGTAYAVRVYNTALNLDEANWNHFVDIVAYNGYDIAKINALSDFAKKVVATSFANVSIEDADLTNLDAVASVSETDYDELYVKESSTGAQLIGLYTAFFNGFETTKSDLAAGKWTNKVASEAEDDIVLTQTASMYWSVSTNGGFLANGVNKDTCLYVNNVRMELPDAWAALADFTVESAQILHGVTDCASMPQPYGKYHMRIDLLRYHHAGHITNADTLGGGGTWHANTSDAWHTGGRDKVWRAIYDRNAKAAGGDTLWVNKATA
ncbi:MAG: hypothetical protein J6S44_02575, partial [Clostridia bacterium]|nr:hypothetical protein [Clostridia bacterium]